MARKLSQNDPVLSIDFFNSGFYTYRSQLFAPYKPIGVNVVSFHDPVLGGANMEDTDLLEWTRRPGFSKFCSVALAGTEIVNQFDSSRNLNGVVVPWVDTSVRLATFSPTTITTVVPKTIKQQGYITTIGNMTYFADGAAADYAKYDSTNRSAWGLAAPVITPISSGLGFWQPKTSYGVGNSLLDTNGNIESLSSVATANGTTGTFTAFSNIALAGSTLGNWSPSFPSVHEYTTAFQAVSGYSPYLFLQSAVPGLNIPTGAIITGISVTIYKQVGGGSGGPYPAAADESVQLVIGGVPQLISEHAQHVHWDTTGLVAVTYGGVGDTWGLTPTAAQLNATGSTGFGVAISGAVTTTFGIKGNLAVSTNLCTVTVYYEPASATFAPGISGINEPNWALNAGTITPDGQIAWTNYGPVLVWYPLTYYPTPVVILDPNGNLQLGSSTNNVVPLWAVGTTYTIIGKAVSFGGQYWANLLASNTGIPPSSNYLVATALGAVTTSAPAWIPTTTPIATGNIAPVWNTAIGGLTTDNDYSWENIGQGTPIASFGYVYVYCFRTVYGHLTTGSPFSNNTGAILGPVNGSITAFAISAGVITFTGTNNFVVGNVFTVEGLSTITGLTLNGQSFTVTAATPSETFPLTVLQVTTHVLTVTAINNLAAGGGQSVSFSGVTDGTFGPLLNGNTFTTVSASSTSFTVALVTGNYGPITGPANVNVIGSWTAATTAGNDTENDAGSAIPLISTITGYGTALLDAQGFSLCNSVATITAVSETAGIFTLTARNNFQPGIWVTITGLSTAAGLLLNGPQQFQVIAVDNLPGTQNTYFQVFLETPLNYTNASDPGIATFNAVEIYRTSDGGGTYIFTGAVTNPGATTQWSYNDFVTDVNLDELLSAALSHQNDPPPGAPGSTINQIGTISRYWQGHMWLIVGNYIYFDAGSDCTNGVSQEAWPPGNRFLFAGPVLNMEVTPDGVAMMVFLADRVDAILGGPQTISFYATDFLSNFGIANPNAIFRDGSIIGLYSTQRQYWEMEGPNKSEIGNHVADYLTANFASSTAYATMHRDGLDVGVFISNGSNQVLRYGSNIAAWSVPAYPLYGAGALRSIETSVGVYSLMLATPTGGANNYLFARDLNSWGDAGTYGANNGTAYASCYIILGSITLSQPGAKMYPLQHVVGYFDAVGTLNNGKASPPNIWVLPNEISAAAGNGFIQLPEFVQEPPIGQNWPSATLQALRWNVNMFNSTLASQFIHHLQVKIEFEPESAPNTIKALAFGEDQST